MDIIKAVGKNYFQEGSIPIKVNRINRSLHISHEYDLTEIPHYHDFIEVVCVINGQGTQVIENRSYKVSAGDVFVLQGNQQHYFQKAEEVEIINVIYNEKEINGLVDSTIKALVGYGALFVLEPTYRSNSHFSNKLRLKRTELAKLELLINAMLFEQENKQEGYELILQNRLQEFIIILSRHYSEINENKAQSLVRLSQVVSFMEHHSAEKLSLKGLAEQANMSQRNFLRVFKRTFAMTPMNYLNSIRLQLARQLLRETTNAVSHIAYDVGFADSNYFIKCFKKTNGVSPLKYRNRFLTKK